MESSGRKRAQRQMREGVAHDADASKNDEERVRKRRRSRKSRQKHVKRRRLNQAGVTAAKKGEESSVTSREDDKCPICLGELKGDEFSTTNVCEHKFCYGCLYEWSKEANTCPIDRQTFTRIFIINSKFGTVTRFYVPYCVSPI